MIAYKFLAAGRVAPFSGFEWPEPTGDAPGGWVEATVVDSCRSGVHACRVEYLPIWMAPELWRVRHTAPARGVFRTVAGIALRAAALYFRYGGIATSALSFARTGLSFANTVNSFRWSGFRMPRAAFK